MNKNQFLMVIITTFLAISLVFVSANTNPSRKVETSQTQPSSIIISSNADLIAQARQYGWDLGGVRDGSINFPFQINDLYLVSNGAPVVSIQNTNLYVNLDNITVDGQNLLDTGMQFYNVRNLSVLRANIFNLAQSGTSITISYSLNVRVIVSQFYSSNGNEIRGIASANSDYTMIYSNTFTGVRNPIILDNCNNSRVERNYFYDNLSNDIFVGSSERVSIQYNYHNNSAGTAIEFQSAYLSFVRNNVVNNSQAASLRLYVDTQQVRVFNNIFVNALYSGINVQGSSGNIIAMNDIRANAGQGISLDATSIGNVIEWNNFVNNRIGLIQAIDDGVDNYFLYNHYSDHVGNDVNLDNYEDTPYFLDGAAAGNNDTIPLSVEHIVQPTVLTTPTRLSQFSGLSTITWDPFSSNYITDFSYTIFYRSYLSSQWVVMTSNYAGTSFSWDFSGLEDGKYQIRIATSFPISLLSTSDASRDFFVRNNHLSPTQLFRPNGGETLNSSFEIRWRHSFDLDGHAVHYSVSISNNDGTTWDLLQGNLVANYYNFDFGSLAFGDQYLIKIVADDGVGNTVTDVSDAVFTAGIPVTITTTPTTPITSYPPTTSPPESTKPTDESSSSTGPGLPVPIPGIQLIFMILLSFAFLTRKRY